MATKPTQKFYKPLPYTFLRDSNLSKDFAHWLRSGFSVLLKRRLPQLYYSGFRHGYIPQYIQKHKKQYPYFIKADIAKFYPNIQHKNLIVQTQIAYKKLTGLQYVPNKFKKEFLPQAYAFHNALELQHVGLPLDSAVSKSWAPLIYVPLLLDIRKKYDCKFLVFVDDFLILTTSVYQQDLVYKELHNGLNKQGLDINRNKLQCGCMGKEGFSYCGYRFSGGYVSVSAEKINAFKTSFKEICTKQRNKPIQTFIKRINQKIKGFGHYYKFGHIKRLYSDLDRYIVATIKKEYLDYNNIKSRGNSRAYLSRWGLYKLYEIANGVSQSQTLKQKVNRNKVTENNAKNLSLVGVHQLLGKLVEQNKKIIGLLQNIDYNLRLN